MYLKILNHFTGIWKRLIVTVWGSLPWSRYANAALNHDKVSIYCALLTSQWKQNLRSTSMQVEVTWSLKCSIAQLDDQNRKFVPVLIIIEAKMFISLCTNQRWLDSGILLSDPILFLKNDIRIWSKSLLWLKSYYPHPKTIRDCIMMHSIGYIFVLCLFCLFRQNNCWRYFVFSWIRLVEVVTWQVWNACPAWLTMVSEPVQSRAWMSVVMVSGLASSLRLLVCITWIVS